MLCSHTIAESSISKATNLTTKSEVEGSRKRSHKGNEPLLPQTKCCPLCPAKFTRTTHLNRHLRSHSNERTHRCNHCSADFTRSDLLARHKRKCGDVVTLNKSRQRSCRACAESKVKCDLQQPCSKCTSRGKECVFINDPEVSRKAISLRTRALARRSVSSLQDAEFSSSSSSKPEPEIQDSSLTLQDYDVAGVHYASDVSSLMCTSPRPEYYDPRHTLCSETAMDINFELNPGTRDLRSDPVSHYLNTACLQARTEVELDACLMSEHYPLTYNKSRWPNDRSCVSNFSTWTSSSLCGPPLPVQFIPSDYSIGPNFAIQLGSTNASECFPPSTEGFRRYCMSPPLSDEFQVSEGIAMQNRMARLIISSNQLLASVDDTSSSTCSASTVCL